MPRAGRKPIRQLELTTMLRHEDALRPAVLRLVEEKVAPREIADRLGIDIPIVKRIAAAKELAEIVARPQDFVEFYPDAENRPPSRQTLLKAARAALVERSAEGSIPGQPIIATKS